MYQEADEDLPPLSFGVPFLVVGISPEHAEYDAKRHPVSFTAGRFFREGEENVAVIGFNLAKAKNLALGKTLMVKGRSLEIIGIMDQTLTAQDSIAYTPLRTAQELLARSLPMPWVVYELASQVEVYAIDLKWADHIAETINRQLRGIRALPPSQIEPRFRQNFMIFNAIALGSALMAVFIGGLSIFNTMMMSVSERTREIGVKKAVGAADADIAGEFLAEAIVIGLIGGTLGVVAGSLLAALANSFAFSGDVVIFAVTWRLTLISVATAVVTGALSGLYPALRAGRLKPVDALRV